MSKEDVQKHVDIAIEMAVTGNVPLDDVDDILEDARHRIDELRVLRGEK